MHSLHSLCELFCVLTPTQSVRAFFHKNMDTCLDWLSRVRGYLVSIALHAGMPAVAVRHGFAALKDFSQTSQKMALVRDTHNTPHATHLTSPHLTQHTTSQITQHLTQHISHNTSHTHTHTRHLKQAYPHVHACVTHAHTHTHTHTHINGTFVDQLRCFWSVFGSGGLSGTLNTDTFGHNVKVS